MGGLCRIFVVMDGEVERQGSGFYGRPAAATTGRRQNTAAAAPQAMSTLDIGTVSISSPHPVVGRLVCAQAGARAGGTTT